MVPVKQCSTPLTSPALPSSSRIAMVSVVCLARVDDDRTPELARQLELRAKYLLLHIPRRIVVVIVEANLADRTRCRRRHQLRAHDVRRMLRVSRKLVCGVRMHANRQPHVRPERFDCARLRGLLAHHRPPE